MCHVIIIKGVQSLFLGLVRSSIYILLIFIWMISIKERTDPLNNDEYSKYFRQTNEIIDKLIKES